MSSQDVEKLKKLLGQGFQILSETITIEKIPGTTDQFTNIIKLVLGKGDEKKEIVSAEEDVFEFMLHFVKMKDQYDNYVFVYVDDYQKYRNFESDKIPKSYVNEHIIEIGSRRFDKGIMIMQLIPVYTPKTLPYCEFLIDVKDNTELKNIDYKDYVKIIEKKSGNVVFNGFIDHSYNSQNSQFFICIGGEKTFSHTKISLSTNNVNPNETMYFIAKTGNTNVKFDESVKKQFTQREFVIIMPVGNLILQENISIGNTTIYHKLDSYEDHLIRKSEVANKDEDWNGNNLRIRTKVVADSFYSAVMQGYKKISTIIDCLAFRSDFSLPYYEISGKKINFDFSSYRYFSRIKVFPKIFCRERASAGYLLFDLMTVIENKLVFDSQGYRFFEPVKDLFEHLILKESDSLTPLERSILASCHWLRLAIFSRDMIERLLFLYNSLEFAISEINIKKEFSNDELNLLKTKVAELHFTEKQNAKIIQQINDLNNPSLFDIIEQYCDENNISITKEEWDLIRSTRRKRNDIIHGKKDVLVNLIENEKLQTLIERILISRLKKSN